MANLVVASVHSLQLILIITVSKSFSVLKRVPGVQVLKEANSKMYNKEYIIFVTHTNPEIQK